MLSCDYVVPSEGRREGACVVSERGGEGEERSVRQPSANHVSKVSGVE